jgi:hypothetical protein
MNKESIPFKRWILYIEEEIVIKNFYEKDIYIKFQICIFINYFLYIRITKLLLNKINITFINIIIHLI